MFARGTAPEVPPREEDRRAAIARVVHDEGGIRAPRLEEPGRVAGALDPLEPVARDDLVGVDVGAAQGQRAAGDAADRLHQRRSAGSAKWPAIAVAAATVRDTKCVRPPGPCRPSQLPVDV